MAQTMTNATDSNSSSGQGLNSLNSYEDHSCSSNINNIASIANSSSIANASSFSSASASSSTRNIFPYNSPKHSLTDYRQQGKLGNGNATPRPPLPVASATHYSDSGFGSTFSSGSGSSYLPPPPPYRMNVRRQQRIHRSLSDSKYGGTMDPYMVSSSRGSWGFSRVTFLSFSLDHTLSFFFLCFLASKHTLYAILFDF